MPEGITLTLHQDEAQSLEVAIEACESIAVQLEALQTLREELLRLVRAVVGVVLRYPDEMRARWQDYRRLGMAGHAGVVHALRADFQEHFEARLRLIERARQAVEKAAAKGGQVLPEAAKLPQVAEDLRRLRNEIFQDWNTLEDLEDRLAASFPLPEDKLEALGQRHQAPPVWYEQEGKPF